MVDAIRRISSNDYSSYGWPDTASVTSKQPPTTSSLPPILYQDTLQTCDPTVKKSSEKELRPILTPPSEQISHFPDLEHLLMACLEAQRQSRMDTSKIASENMFQEQKIKRKLHERVNEIQDKVNDASANSKIADWIGMALSGGIVLSLIGSLAVAFTTGGASFLLTAIQGGLMVAKGVNTGVKGYLDHQSNQHTSELVGLSHGRTESHRKMQGHMKQSKDALDHINTYISMQKEILRNQHDACHIQA